jgi:hypothetical protein
VNFRTLAAALHHEAGRRRPALQSYAMRVLVLIVAAVLGTRAQSGPASPAVTKVLALFGSLQSAQQKYQPVAFRLTEAEINEYAAYALAVTPRPGLTGIFVKVFPNNYLSTYAIVDFDAVEKWKPGTIPTLLKPVLSGQRDIWLDVRFQISGGRATYSVEKAYFQSVRLPALFVQQLIRVVAARQPEHYDTSKPVPLPFGLKTLSTASQAISGAN